MGSRRGDYDEKRDFFNKLLWLRFLKLGRCCMEIHLIIDQLCMWERTLPSTNSSICNQIDPQLTHNFGYSKIGDIQAHFVPCCQLVNALYVFEKYYFLTLNVKMLFWSVRSWALFVESAPGLEWVKFTWFGGVWGRWWIQKGIGDVQGTEVSV